MTFWKSGVMSPWHSTDTAAGRLMANIETSVSTPTESSFAWSASPTPATCEGRARGVRGACACSARVYACTEAS
jgi:hypothetical protein